ncbi:MAG: protein adenylyltransferase SelO [Pyrinomonadaceae bacterium]
MKLNIADTFNKELAADPILDVYSRQVSEAFFSYVTPRKPTNPTLIHFSAEMMEAIGLSAEAASSKEFLDVFSGNEVLKSTHPYAMNYGGHQFGTWAGQLGDGRAINLFEIKNIGARWALQLKGAGKTPYSRGADGLAVLRSSIREYLCSEAMHYLGVPTTRALSLMLTGDLVERDMLYDGHPEMEKGAVICRAAPTFLRFGNFQIFAARNEIENLRILASYTLRHFFPEFGAPTKKAYLALFKEVTNRTLDLIIQWERVGFVHGVMNTDNLSILGLTIDYGPYGWLEDFDPNWTPNTTDAGGKRYRFGYQGSIALWNLLQLANAIYPLVEDAPALEAILEDYQSQYVSKHVDMMSRKLGFREPATPVFIAELEALLETSEMDMTIFFRLLGDFEPVEVKGFLPVLETASYSNDFAKHRESWLDFLQRYTEKLLAENLPRTQRKSAMNAVNPKYVLRNYMAQLAIDAANDGDYSLIDELFTMLSAPYDEQPKMQKWFAKRPEWAKSRVGCSMLSCSS